jgi:transitional endoplasmic reticulum ATPase
LVAIRKRGAEVSSVTGEDFADALADSRATVTPEMEEEYAKMTGELKRRAMEVMPIGFLAPGMVSSTRESKHGGG